MQHLIMVVRYQEEDGGITKTGIIIDEKHIISLDGSIPKEIWNWTSTPFDGCMLIDDCEE